MTTDDPQFQRLRAIIEQTARMSGIAAEPQDVALAMLLVACDSYGGAKGFEHVGGWLRVVAATYEQSYHVTAPHGATVQ